MYSLNPSTKAATVINDNNPAIWYAINNWAVTDDDSLIAVGYFRDGSAYGYTDGVIKFGTTGEPADKLVGSPNICCGNGMLYNKATETMLLANGNNNSDGEIVIDTIMNGEITGSVSITTFTDFPDDLSAQWCVVKAMVKDKAGNVYAILFNDDTPKTYFVKIDIEGEEITYISTLGVDDDNQYNSLAIIPAKYAK